MANQWTGGPWACSSMKCSLGISFCTINNFELLSEYLFLYSALGNMVTFLKLHFFFFCTSARCSLIFFLLIFRNFTFSSSPGIYQKILAGKIKFPSHFSEPAKDLICGLLTADRTQVCYSLVLFVWPYWFMISCCSG